MPAYVTGKHTSNVEIDGSRPKRRVIRWHFKNDPVISSILYSMRDPENGNNSGGMKKMKVNDVEATENQLSYADFLLAMCEENQAETRPSTCVSVGRPHTDGEGVTLMGSSIDNGGPNIGSVGSDLGQGADNAAIETIAETNEGSKAAYSQRYKDVMDALLMPESSYDLLHVPHLVPKSKKPRQNVTREPTQESMPKANKTPTKTEARYRSFPRTVRTLVVTGMLDGAAVLYLSASREKELRGIIKGTSYLCGCKSCDYSTTVNAYGFETHAGCKTCHPNNHIYLKNGKSLHQVVQELRNIPVSLLCDAIQTVIGDSLNQEVFSSWKEAFEAATHEVYPVRETEVDRLLESSTPDENTIQL